MAVKFLEPGGDATFAITTVNGFWGRISGAPAIATDFVHGGHIKSIKYPSGGSGSYLNTNNGIVADAGSRVSFYLYLNALPTTSKASVAAITTASDAASIVRLYLTTAGVLQLWRGAAVAQVGSNGSTLSTGVWYRITISYTISSSTVNEFRVYKDGVLDITASNTASITTASSTARFGNFDNNAGLDMRSSDHYVDDSSALTDTGNIWVTAKRPNANGTTNGFTTQIGSGGSGYGSGHSPQVNERALSLTNGWSVIGAGSAVTEEYNIESSATGDIDISSATIVDYAGWVSANALTGETGSIIVNGSSSNINLGSTVTMFTKVAGSSTYPSGTGTDIGIISSTTVTTVSLYECGIVVAYIPGASSASSSPSTSISSSPSTSPSHSPSTSPSSSPSPSSSISSSPSSSPSHSPSSSPSNSPSSSPSPSSSVSSSPSTSPSSSPSPSSSVSSSPSTSPSSSPSPSSSASTSPSSSSSTSVSSSPSTSVSSSVSSSISASPSPGYEDYTREEAVSLPADNADLTTAYSTQDYLDVATDNGVKVGQTASPPNYAMHEFKDYVGVESSCTVKWKGQSDEGCSVSTVFLQIYNFNTTTWDTLASDNTSVANVDFILTAFIPILTNYKDGSNVISCRVWQQSV